MKYLVGRTQGSALLLTAKRRLLLLMAAAAEGDRSTVLRDLGDVDVVVRTVSTRRAPAGHLHCHDSSLVIVHLSDNYTKNKQKTINKPKNTIFANQFLKLCSKNLFQFNIQDVSRKREWNMVGLLCSYFER